MTWHENLAEANWIHLGYLAANTSSLLVPLSKGKVLNLTPKDSDLLKQQAQFFDAAVSGWASFEEPALLFQKPEHAFVQPAGALEIATEIYSAVHGGPVGDPNQFRGELQTYGNLLKRIADGETLTTEELPTARNLSTFLDALMSKARAVIHESARTTRY